MRIPSFGSIQFGSSEWLEYWEDNPKKDAIEFLEFMSWKYVEKEAEALELRKMVDWLVATLEEIGPGYSKEEITDLARKASQDEA